MTLSRRRLLKLTASAATLPAVAAPARAQTYPSRPVRIIVGFAAGTTADIVARLVGQWLSERLGQSFVIENRTGAASNLAAEAVVRAPPDGYTLLQATATNAVNATLYDNLGFSFVRDIVPVASIDRTPDVMEINPSLPVRTVLEFIAHAKAHPGTINMATTGTGGGPHLYGELFKAMAGIDMVDVPYRGDALPALIGGQVQVMFAPLPQSIGYIRAGALRALAVTTATRLEVLPDVPPVSDFLPGYEASGFMGIGAPRGTPAEIVDKLNREINAGLADPKLKTRLADLGLTVPSGAPADFGRLIAEETQKWGKVIKAASIKPE
ncbi:MAG TPA: tripartite tricarboxylate transporter substrate binding protein [Xanthobacteraceae bacterium]|nr:tripartite tricarboxylate transporter substrate binding protein [Xanthobacteraceae bacterium]